MEMMMELVEEEEIAAQVGTPVTWLEEIVEYQRM